MHEANRARYTQMRGLDGPAIFALLQVLGKFGVVIVDIPILGFKSVADGRLCHGQKSRAIRLRLMVAIRRLTRSLSVDTGTPRISDICG